MRVIGVFDRILPMVTRDKELMYIHQFSKALDDGIYVLISKSNYDVVNILLYFTNQTYSRVENEMHFTRYKGMNKNVREGEENKDHSCLN